MRAWFPREGVRHAIPDAKMLSLLPSRRDRGRLVRDCRRRDDRLPQRNLDRQGRYDCRRLFRGDDPLPARRPQPAAAARDQHPGHGERVQLRGRVLQRRGEAHRQLHGVPGHGGRRAHARAHRDVSAAADSGGHRNGRDGSEPSAHGGPPLLRESPPGAPQDRAERRGRAATSSRHSSRPSRRRCCRSTIASGGYRKSGERSRR